jgi:hypothetical protein
MITTIEHPGGIKEIKEKIENYISTIHVSQAFISLVTWKDNRVTDGTHYSFGRRMNTSDQNRISPNELVTPDIVIQCQPDLGYIVEVKKTLSKDNREWENVSKQIIKYDDLLTGWWESSDETIDKQCVVLLIHQTRSIEFCDFFREYGKRDNITIAENISIVEFNRADESNQYYFLRLQFGHIYGDQLERKLHNGIDIPIMKVLSSYGTQKFNDHEPPVVEYMMAILWQDIFNSMRGKDIDKRYKGFPIEVNVNQLVTELQKLYGSEGKNHRDVEFPQKKWVVDAMDAFVDRGFAWKSEGDKFIVIFKLLRRDPIEVFSEAQKKSLPELKERATQLNLL